MLTLVTPRLEDLCFREELYDADNPSYKLFLKNGFEVEYENEEVVMVRKELDLFEEEDEKGMSFLLG